MTVKLPVLSSAASTDFVSHTIVGRDEIKLHIDGNQKVSGWKPTPNAFSLVQIETCPGSTPTCQKSCYVHALEGAAKNIHDLYRENTTAIQHILTMPEGYQAAWATRVANYILSNNQDTGFRWHVSGDLFSGEYAAWVATVVELSAPVRHWIYTRSFELSAAFVGLENITVNYSVDRDNYERARPYAAAHASVGWPVRLCYLTTDDGEVPSDLPEGSVIFPDYSLRGARNYTAEPAMQRECSTFYQRLPQPQRRMLCPVDFYGKSEGNRCAPFGGGCAKCIKRPE